MSYMSEVHGKGICGSSAWAAARETSTKTNAKCDEEGLEVALCTHCILLREHDAAIGIKKEVFDKVMQLERLIEEDAILVEEMRQHWNHLTKTCKALRDQAGVLSDDLATQRTLQSCLPKSNALIVVRW
ncbi:hypothetical protein AOLI_G00057280 [Acnodon oligacanthus]